MSRAEPGVTGIIISLIYLINDGGGENDNRAACHV